MNIKKKIILMIQKVLSQCVYSVFSLIYSKAPKSVTFVSNRSNELDGNLKALYEKMNDRNIKVGIRVLTEKYNNTFKGKFEYFCFFIKFYYVLSRSNIVLIDDYLHPLYFIKKNKNTKVFQLWHAAGAFKKFGYSALNKKYGPSSAYTKMIKIHSNYDYAIVSSKNVAAQFAEAFDMNVKNILPFGLPRTDVFFEENYIQSVKRSIYKKFPNLHNKKILLYAPTFRGTSNSHEISNVHLDIEKLKNILGENYFLIVHLHPYLSNESTLPIDLHNFAGIYNGKLTINESMIISDLLISDYSSVIFEYSLLGKPMCFFSPDLEEYKEERDFYFEYQTFIPGPMFDKTGELAHWIKEQQYNIEKVTSFSQYFFDDHDGCSTTRILDRIVKDLSYF